MMTRDEQRLVRAAGGFLNVIEHHGDLTGVPGWPLVGGRSGGDIWPEKPGASIEYGGKGVWVHYCTPSDSRQLILLVRWRTIQSHGASLPTSLLTRIREHRTAQIKHQISSPSYPNRHADPERWAEIDRHHREVRMPEYRRLRDECTALLNEVYPLTVDHEPTDLLELLAAIS